MAYILTPLGSALEWETAFGVYPDAVKLDSTHWLVVYRATTNLEAIVFAIDGSGNVSEIGTPFAFDTSGLADQFPEVTLYDSDTAVVVYKSTDSDGFARALSINTSTWAVTSGGTAFEFELDALTNSDIEKVPGFDAFVVVARASTGNDGFAYALTFNPGTGALALGNTALEFDTQNCFRPSLANVNNDPTRWLVVYEFAGADGNAKVLTLNTSTWAFTDTSSLEFDTSEARFMDMVPLDGNHFLVVWTDVTAGISEAQVLAVNLSTWAITVVGSPITLDATTFTASGEHPNSLAILDHPTGKYVVARAYRSLANGDINLDVLTVNDSTWAVTLDTELGSVSAMDGIHPHIQAVSATRAIVWWSETSTNDGFVRAFDIVEAAAPSGQDNFFQFL